MGTMREPPSSRRCRQCGGAFVDPVIEPHSSRDTEDSEVIISSDTSEVTDSEMVFSGNVTVRQGNRLISADQVIADRQRETATAAGGVLFREPGLALEGEEINYESQSDIARITDARFVLHERQLSGRAKSLTRQSNGRLHIDDGSLTYCAPDDPTWMLRANSLSVDPQSGDGQAWGAKLDISGIPILYLPWIRFPVDSRRKTGFLFPEIGSDTRGGIDVTTPIYFNLAPNYDALYSPRYIEERGFLHQAQGRLLSADYGYWELNGGYISNDSKYKDESGDGSRWIVDTKHQGRFGDHISTQIKFSKTSDSEYLRDLNNNNLSAQRQTSLQQLGRVDWVGSDWRARLDVEQFQSLAQDIRDDYKKLPQITTEWIGNSHFWGLQPTFMAQLSHFDSDSEKVTGERLYSEIGLTHPVYWESGFLRSAIKYRSIAYELNDFVTPIDKSPDSGSLMGSLDSGLIFERQVALGGLSFTQTLEPRAYYLFSEYDDPAGQPDFDSAELTFSYSQLYRDTRFSGHDRIDDANQLSLGVTTRFYDNQTGDEVFSASLGQIVYFRDRKVRLKPFDSALAENTSPIAAEVAWSPNSVWRLRGSFLYDTNENTFDAAYAQGSYSLPNGAIFNLGYTLREPPPSLLDRPVTEQANASVFYPINEYWSVFGAFEYSLESSTSVEDMFGVEYDDCCWRMRFLYMRYVDTLVGDFPDLTDPNLPRENAFQLQIMLKGMGGFGGRVDNLLSDMIRGFAPRP